MANTPYETKAEAEAKRQETYREIKQTTQAISAGEGGKLYDTLATAQALATKPADGTVFTVSEKTDAENAGVHVFDSTKPGGTKFERRFPNSRVRSNELLTEIKDERTEPLFIDSISFVKSFDGSFADRTAVLAVTAQTVRTMTVDTTPWGTSVTKAPIAVKFSDGSFKSFYAVNITSTSVEVDEDILGTVVDLMCMHDGNNGQHLTDYGYKAMADYLWNYDKRTAFRYRGERLNPFENDTIHYLNPGWYDPSDSTKLNYDWKFIGGAGGGGYTQHGVLARGAAIASISLDDYLRTSEVYRITQGGAIGMGVSLDRRIDKEGFIEVFVGVDVDLDSTADFVLEMQGTEVFRKAITFANIRVTVPVTPGEYTLKFVTATTKDTRIGINDIIFWEKRPIEGTIFKTHDRVLFLTDSWGEFPLTSVETEKSLRYDGTKTGGKSSLPKRFAEHLASPGNSLIAARGGFTSEWARYWISDILRETKPTHVVLHFGINDYNSKDEFDGNISSGYDFSPTDKWAALSRNSGGIFGSANQEKWIENLKDICTVCTSMGVQPVIFTPPYTASISQAQGLSHWDSALLGGFNY